MFLILGKYRKKYHQAANIYAERYPNHERKSHMAFKWLSERFITYGERKEKYMKKNRY